MVSGKITSNLNHSHPINFYMFVAFNGGRSINLLPHSYHEYVSRQKDLLVLSKRAKSGEKLQINAAEGKK